MAITQRNSELPPAGEAHDVLRVILSLYGLQARQVTSVDLGHRRPIHCVIAVQRRVADILTFGVRSGGDRRRARLDGVDEVLVGEVCDPGEVQVEREQAPGAVRRVCGVGSVREDVRIEGLDVVGKEDTRGEHSTQVCTPELVRLIHIGFISAFALEPARTNVSFVMTFIRSLL